MPDKKFDPSKVVEIKGRLYKDVEFDYGQGPQSRRKLLSASEQADYIVWKRQNRNVSDILSKESVTQERASLSEKYKKYFGKSSGLTNAGGHVSRWAKPMALKGNASVKDNSFLSYVKDGKLKSVNNWGAKISNSKEISGGTNVLNGFHAMADHLELCAHMVVTQAELFRVMVGKRALTVFKTSFRNQSFNTANSQAWEPLSDSTVNKRMKRKRKPKEYDPKRILREFGDLQNSIKFDEKKGVVYTDRIGVKTSHYKYRDVVFAGYHNEGEGFYGGNPNLPYEKRQFMGHSTALDPFTDRFMKTMMKRYLFDSVFLFKTIK